MFVSVKTLTPAMLVAFQNGDKWEPCRVISQVNGAVYDYAVNVVKELLLDEDFDIARLAIEIANEYGLCSTSLLPQDYRTQLQELNRYPAEKNIKNCGIMLHDAIV